MTEVVSKCRDGATFGNDVTVDTKSPDAGTFGNDMPAMFVRVRKRTLKGWTCGVARIPAAHRLSSYIIGQL